MRAALAEDRPHLCHQPLACRLHALLVIEALCARMDRDRSTVQRVLPRDAVPTFFTSANFAWFSQKAFVIW